MLEINKFSMGRQSTVSKSVTRMHHGNGTTRLNSPITNTAEPHSICSKEVISRKKKSGDLKSTKLSTEQCIPGCRLTVRSTTLFSSVRIFIINLHDIVWIFLFFVYSFHFLNVFG